MNKLLPTPLIAFAWLGYAQTTTIEVPQGSGVLPTVGQVNCLEELGSGRLCAATYECSESSGRLWGDLANHDGRRAIGKDSPVARGRNCTITVDGRAAVRWLTAYSPGGRTGELVGLTDSAEALRPVVRGGSTGSTGEGRSLLEYVLERYDTSLAELTDAGCRHIDQGHVSHRHCVESILWAATGLILPQENALTRCKVAALERTFCEQGDCDLPSVLPNGNYHVDIRDGVAYDCLPQAQEVLAAHGLEYYQPGDGNWSIRLRE